MQRIFFIAKLDLFSLGIALIVKPFFHKVCFFDAIHLFRKQKNLEKIQWFGLVRLSYLGTDSRVWVESLPLHFELLNEFSEKHLLKSFFYTCLIKFNQLDVRGQEKAQATLKSATLNLFQTEIPAIPLVRSFFPQSQYKVYFMPFLMQTYLLLGKLEHTNITLIGIHSFLRVLTLGGIRFIKIPIDTGRQIFKKLKTFFLQKNNKKTENYPHPLNSTFAFFPHKELKYGEVFKKTYLYEDDPNSLFFKEKLLTLFLEEPDTLSKRYFRRFHIPYANIRSLVGKKQVLREYIKIFLKVARPEMMQAFTSLSAFYSFLTIKSFWKEVVRDLNILDHFPDLKVIYVHYDALFPSSFILACHIKGMKTISAQERPIQYTYFPHLCYDHYLTCGEGFQELLKKQGYVVEHFHPVGPIRASLIKQISSSSEKKYERLLEIKKNYKLVVGFGLMPINEFDTGLSSDDGTWSQNNLHFMKIFLTLAKDFPNLYFFIKFKVADFIADEMYQEVVLEIKKSPNVEIIENMRHYNTYTLAGLADLIIGKQTSIMEEALSCGKQVIFYDNENYLSHFEYIFEGMDIIEQNYSGLKKRVHEILDGKYIDPDKMEKFNETYFSTHQTQDGFTLMKEVISQVLHTHTLPAPPSPNIL